MDIIELESKSLWLRKIKREAENILTLKEEIFADERVKTSEFCGI